MPANAKEEVSRDWKDLGDKPYSFCGLSYNWRLLVEKWNLNCFQKWRWNIWVIDAYIVQNESEQWGSDKLLINEKQMQTESITPHFQWTLLRNNLRRKYIHILSQLCQLQLYLQRGILAKFIFVDFGNIIKALVDLYWNYLHTPCRCQLFSRNRKY